MDVETGRSVESKPGGQRSTANQQSSTSGVTPFDVMDKQGDSPGRWGHWGSSQSAGGADASSGRGHSPAASQSETQTVTLGQGGGRTTLEGSGWEKNWKLPRLCSDASSSLLCQNHFVQLKAKNNSNRPVDYWRCSKAPKLLTFLYTQQLWGIVEYF